MASLGRYHTDVSAANACSRQETDGTEEKGAYRGRPVGIEREENASLRLATNGVHRRDKQWACIFQIPILVKSRSVAETIASVGPTESVHPNRNHQATLT